MLKNLVDKYSNEDIDDEPLDEATDKEETEDTEVEETVEEETAEAEEEHTTDEEVVDGEPEEVDEVAEDEQSETNVLEAPTPEQGEVTTVDTTEEVVAEVEPSDDVVEAGDDVGQATPTEAFDGTSDTADITEGSDSGVLGSDDIDAIDAAAVENTLKEGAEVAENQAQIVQQAEQDAGAVDGQPTDENGNTITEEQEVENEEEAERDAEIDAETEEEVTATDVVAEETPLEEAEALADELADDAEESTDEALGEEEGTDDITDESTDSFDTDGTTDSGDLGDDSEVGDESTEDTFDDDDEPLEGAEIDADADVPDTDVVEEEVSEESTDDTTETETTEEAESPNTEVTEGDTTDVQESVDDQNEASAVTAEAASSDVNQTEAIDGNNEVVEDNIEDGLDVEVDDTFKQTEVDGNPSYVNDAQDDTAATVEETIDNIDGTEESVAESVAEDVADDVEEMEAAADEPVEEVVEDEVEPDFDEGEVDIPDVDTDITEDDVVEAVVDSEEEEILADKDEEEAIDATKTIEELQNEAKSLESFIAEMEQAISTETYDPLRVVEFYAKLDEHKNIWGEGTIPSLEDYTANDLDLLYTASLESMRGFFSRTLGLADRLNENLHKWWTRPMVTKVTRRSDAVNKAADKALVELKESSFNGGDVKGVSGYLSTNKDGLVSAVSSDLKYTTSIATKGLKGNEKMLDDLERAINDIVSSKDATAIGNVLKKAKDIKSAKPTYPTEAFTKGNLMGNWKLETKEGSLGKSGVPVTVKEASGDRKTTFKLTKADLSNLLLMAKTYAAVAKKTAETTGTAAVEGAPSLGRLRKRALPLRQTTRIKGEWGDEKDIDALMTDLSQASKAHHDMYNFIVKHALDMSEALIAVVNKAK